MMNRHFGQDVAQIQTDCGTRTMSIAPFRSRNGATPYCCGLTPTARRSRTNAREPERVGATGRAPLPCLLPSAAVWTGRGVGHAPLARFAYAQR
jgi:hypothetical protein